MKTNFLSVNVRQRKTLTKLKHSVWLSSMKWIQIPTSTALAGIVLSKNKLHTPLDHEIELGRTFDGEYYTININPIMNQMRMENS